MVPEVGSVMATGGDCWETDEVGSPTPAAGAVPHDQIHVQSQVQVSGVPMPACVEIVVVLPQNVNVQVQFHGSASAEVAEPVAEPEVSG